MTKYLKKTLLFSAGILAVSTLFTSTVLAEETDEEDNTEEVEESEETDETADETEELEEVETTFLDYSQEPLLSIPTEFPSQFQYDSGVDIAYPEEGVKGIFLTGYSAAGQKLEPLTELVNSTDLNSMVIDVKDDYGNVLVPFDTDNELILESTTETIDPDVLMDHLEENDIYPIARIVVFKDTRLAEERPDLSFLNEDGGVWSNNAGESFVNPYEREVWEYNVEVAIEAAKIGFKDIQFDYVRYPEGFETRDEMLQYTRGEYADSELDNIQSRVEAVSDFVEYAHQELQPYDVDLSVDIFGYAATVEETAGIGQNFSRISENVDVISSMIYPSHWGPGTLGIALPDLEPYNVVNNYLEYENDVLDALGEDAPISRPWLQDFTASYLGAGNYMNYGAAEVEAQIQALYDHGINEFLLWNAGNNYSEGAQYTFD